MKSNKNNEKHIGKRVENCLLVIWISLSCEYTHYIALFICITQLLVAQAIYTQKTN